MNKLKRKLYPLLSIVIGMGMVLVAFIICSLSIRRNLQNEMELTLKDVAGQNVLVINNEIRVQGKLLQGFAAELREHPEQEAEILRDMDTFVGSYGFKRMGIAHADGVAYTTDNHTVRMGDYVFFQKCMEGKIWLTAALEDRVDGDGSLVNVFSIPIYGEDGMQTTGMVFAVYQNESFRDMLDVDFFEGRGFGCIITSEGEVIAHSQNSPLESESNFFEYLLADGEGNDVSVRQMKADIQVAADGIGTCGAVYENGDEFLFYYMPLNENLYDAQWYMLAFVPEDVVTQRMAPVIKNVRALAIFMVFVAALGIGLYVYIEKKRKEELVNLAYVDRLTGGYNFASFRENSKRRKNLSGYVIAMDLAEFKLINSSFGVQKGDETLLELWKLLLQNVSDSEMAARVNADRFALFWQEGSREALEIRLEELITDISLLSGQLKIPPMFPVFGIYYTDTLDEPDKYYGYAVQAKHLVKGRRDKHYAFYDEIDYKQLVENRKLEDDFQKDLKQERFEVWYQPKFSAADEQIMGAEALVRWRREDGKLLPPGVFIPLFEKNGNIAVLDEYIFRKVCEQQKKWLNEGRRVLPVSVNISRVSLYFGDIVERYENILHAADLSAKYVQLEITESAAIDQADIAELIERFHQAGFVLLMDDFGSGYSSLASLNTLNFDILKLDKSLIDYIGDEKGEKLLKYVTKLGQSLGLHITAEGVETESQLLFMRKLKCNDIQGYYFSKPLCLADYEDLMYI
ncbi:MAG: EAL domain-containing protein [Clostridium sp.]|nr:EAL domain-containing protein [Acetatifactor muris]MCM1527555.1 EAL domain-containing protein [Bacteroides sp.]MCM1563797.1 EAL domain-containing protein [Clostridium sp.]